MARRDRERSPAGVRCVRRPRTASALRGHAVAGPPPATAGAVVLGAAYMMYTMPTRQRCSACIPVCIVEMCHLACFSGLSIRISMLLRIDNVFHGLDAVLGCVAALHTRMHRRAFAGALIFMCARSQMCAYRDRGGLSGAARLPRAPAGIYIPRCPDASRHHTKICNF